MKVRQIFPVIFLVLILILPTKSWAACPGGTLYYNTGNNTMEWCNGTQWFSAQGPQPATTANFLTTGTTWIVPSDWNSASNKIELISGGAGGQNGWCGVGSGAGGYIVTTNLTLTAGATVHYSVGAGGAGGAGGTVCNNGSNGGPSWFNGTTTGTATIWIAGGQSNNGSGVQPAPAVRSLQAGPVKPAVMQMAPAVALVQADPMVSAP